jgi:hypothetical protein
MDLNICTLVILKYHILSAYFPYPLRLFPWAQQILGLDAGDIQVFLDFLEDEQDKWLGMTDVKQEQKDEESLPWQHLPPPPAYPSQSRLSLATAAVALAQECKAQFQSNQIKEGAMEIETTEA